MDQSSQQLPIAQQWFVRSRIDDAITHLIEPHVHPFLRCNIWHVRGRDRDLIVDTGMGLSPLRKAAADLLEKPLAVVITHTHMDHSGGAHEFDCCHVHRDEAESLRDAADFVPLKTGLWPEEFRTMMEEDGPLTEYVITARPSAAFDPDAHRLEKASPQTLIAEGDVVDLGDRVFEVLHLPGHSPGSVGLWEARTGTLFSGDAVYDAQLLDELPGSDKVVYRKTMERLLELPVEVVHGGHEKSFGRDRLREIVTTYLEG